MPARLPTAPPKTSTPIQLPALPPLPALGPHPHLFFWGTVASRDTSKGWILSLTLCLKLFMFPQNESLRKVSTPGLILNGPSQPAPPFPVLSPAWLQGHPWTWQHRPSSVPTLLSQTPRLGEACSDASLAWPFTPAALCSPHLRLFPWIFLLYGVGGVPDILPLFFEFQGQSWL